jgi:hypothetical protein
MTHVRIREHNRIELLGFVVDEDGTEVRVRMTARTVGANWRCDRCGRSSGPECPHARLIAERPFPLPSKPTSKEPNR